MRALNKILLVITFVVLFLTAGITVKGAYSDVGDYIIGQSADKYELYISASGETKIFESLSEAIGYTQDLGGSIIFNYVVADESITFTDKYCSLGGNLTLLGKSVLTVAEGATLELKDINIKFCDSEDLSKSGSGYVRIKGGEVDFTSGSVYGGKECAFLLDYSSLAKLNISGGKIVCEVGSAIKCNSGVTSITGGEISSVYGNAIENSATLNISGAFSIMGGMYDIVTDKPVRISFGESSNPKRMSIQYVKEFSKGTITEILQMTDKYSEEYVSVYDKNGEMYELKFFESHESTDELNFSAVYLPFYVRFIDNSEVLYTAERLMYETVSIPQYTAPLGYYFDGWYADEAKSQRFDFSTPILHDTDIYLSKELKAPSYSLLSIDSVYDSEYNILKFEEIAHELDGEYTYEWYKDGEFISSASYVKILNVSDSGSYKCKLRFSYGADFVEIYTEEVAVTIRKKCIEPPQIIPKKYNGNVQYPDIESSELYSVNTDGGMNVGVYSVVISITDRVNYMWSYGDEYEYSGVFIIEKGDNKWLSMPRVADYYENNSPICSAESLFGTPEFFYSYDENGIYISGFPNVPGEYYFKCEIGESENYYALKTDAVKFIVLREIAIGLYIHTPPEKNSYLSFEEFIPDGLKVIVDFNSGRQLTLDNSVLKFSYQNGEVFRYGDTGINVSYDEASVLLPITVKKAEYDLSNIHFESITATYNGKFISYLFTDELPTGMDGIPLYAEVKGGGTDVGEYTLSLIFSTKSVDYKVPEPMLASLSVVPKIVDLFWGETVFTYNTFTQAPRAYFFDVRGIKTEVTVSGGKTNAGEGYIALAGEPINYSFTNKTCVFTIMKADYDTSSVCLANDSFVYDGTKKNVSIAGLPLGISVIGYVDNSGTDVGEYCVSFSISYDTLNYNEPNFTPLYWNITPAEYDLSPIKITDRTVIYDGNMHYPVIEGEMPRGVDGIQLEYRILSGASDVSQGKKACIIEFYTLSKNYIPPASVVAYVEVLPMPITVVWTDLTFTYDGARHLPGASSEVARINVSGAEIDAGTYSAIAESADSNYTVINDTCEFTVRKAANMWTTDFEINDIYEGQELAFRAEALIGTVLVEFFTDYELENRIEMPSSAGIYYARATVDESKNYFELSSDTVRFEIIPVVAIGVRGEILNNGFKAYESLKPTDFRITADYNNGDTEELSGGDVRIIYENGDSLRAKDTSVKFEALGFSVSVSITVSKNSYDLSGLTVLNHKCVYDGYEKQISVSGLPDGVEIKSIAGGVGVSAGTYSYEISFSYDEENYTEIASLSGCMIIERKTLALPDLKDLTYNGKPQLPEAPDGCVILSENGGTNAGEFYCKVKLSDPVNYIFENGSEEIDCVYRILPLTVMLEISDAPKYLFEKWREPQVTVLTDSVDGSSLSLSFYEENGKIYAISDNPNYKISYTPSEVYKTRRMSDDALQISFFILLLIISLSLGLFIIIKRKNDILTAIAKRRGSAEFVKRNEQNTASAIAALPEPKKDYNDEWEPEIEKAPTNEYEDIMSVDMLKADSLITDSMAKNLIKSGVTVATTGNKKDIVNVNILSDNFNPGDKVDINDLKNKSLISSDVGYIKVLADGSIDKPLKVYANAFSMPAVKMIALTGGEAIKTDTVRQGKRRKKK